MKCHTTKRSDAAAGKMHLFLVCAVLLTVVWMGVIFAFSAQPDTESSEVSGHVSYQLVEGWNEVFQLGHTEAELEAEALRIEFPVRKCAHMTEFAILALLILADIAARRGRPAVKQYGLALFITFLYACTDEFHQLFVSGRACRFTDVMIDTTGAFLGLFLVYLIVRWVPGRTPTTE